MLVRPDEMTTKPSASVTPDDDRIGDVAPVSYQSPVTVTPASRFRMLPSSTTATPTSAKVNLPWRVYSGVETSRTAATTSAGGGGTAGVVALATLL